MEILRPHPKPIETESSVGCMDLRFEASQGMMVRGKI